MVIFRNFIAACLLLLALSACVGSGAPVSTVAPPTMPATATLAPSATSLPPTLTATAEPTGQATESATATALPSPTPEDTPTKGPTPTLAPDAWQTAPVLPTSVSQRVKLIYQMGLLNGNNPRAFSKVGDCNTTMPYFLGDFDTSGQFALGEYAELQETLDYFAGSFGRTSLAAKDGLTAHASLSVLWNTWKDCETYETPLTCEYRIHKPMYALISFGTNDANGNVDFELALRKVIEMTIGNSIVPILSTKADNAEGDNSFNQAIVRLAYEYELPLWNYWLAVQSLPDKGLRSPEHLSVGPGGFSSLTGEDLDFGWPVRNLTAIQALEAVRRAVEAPEN
jgi:hypothetical protein